MNEDVLETPNELDALKARADMLGLSYHPSIGVEKLREKVNTALTEQAPEPAAPPKVVAVVEETPHARLVRRKREATELIRIRITCMNPNKKEWDGEVITAGNATVGTHKKYIPFNVDEGWHVPRIIYEQLLARECQVFFTKKNDRGMTVRQGKLIREFAIEVLPMLTEKELNELARRQAMAKSVD